MLHIDDFKKVASNFIETEVVPKSPYALKPKYIALSIVLPRMIDSFIDSQQDFLHISGILNEDNLIDVDETERFGVDFLTRLDGYELLGIKFRPEDVHCMATMARRYE